MSLHCCLLCVLLLIYMQSLDYFVQRFYDSIRIVGESDNFDGE